MKKPSDDSYSDKEAQRRFETALRAGLSMSPKPHDQMKLGKPRRKTTGKRPTKKAI
jgi:hypothetical protein